LFGFSATLINVPFSVVIYLMAVYGYNVHRRLNRSGSVIIIQCNVQVQLWHSCNKFYLRRSVDAIDRSFTFEWNSASASRILIKLTLYNTNSCETSVQSF